MTITRPDLKFDEKRHTYTLDGKKLAGVSTVAKVGDDNVWGVASAWAWRIGYEGAHDIVYHGDDAPGISKDDLREALKQAKLTPWSKTKKAQDRGIAIHDALEQLAQTGDVPILEQYPEAERGYVQALCRWFLDYRPEFQATEVQVVSEQHGFAGRYDLRCKISEERLWVNGQLERMQDAPGDRDYLCLIDLKTGKRVYPTTQFPQLAGYELASVEMGFPRTDAQFILNVHDDGSYEMVRSCASVDDYLAYLAAYRAINDIKERCK